MKEREQERAEEAQKQADNVAHNRFMLKDIKCSMLQAFQCPKPLLHQIQGGNLQSNILPNQEDKLLKIPRGKIRCTHASIDSIPGKEIDIGDIDSVEPSLRMVST